MGIISLKYSNPETANDPPEQNGDPRYHYPIHSISLPLQAQTQEIVRGGLPGQLFARHHSRTLSSETRYTHWHLHGMV